MRRIRAAAAHVVRTFADIIGRNRPIALLVFGLCGICIFGGGVHIAAERDLVPMGPFEPWHLQDDQGVPARIQVGMLAVTVVALLRRTAGPHGGLLVGWAAVHAVFAIGLITRFQDDLFDDTRVAAAAIGVVLIGAATTLIVVGRRARFTLPLGVATIATIGGGGVLDRVHWRLSTTSLEGPLNLLEGGWELVFVGLTMLVAIDLAGHGAD